MRPVRERVRTVDRPHLGVRLVTEHVGREQRRREQHQRVEAGDRHQHDAGREPVGCAHNQGVADEHQRHDADQPPDMEVQAGAAERTGEPPGHGTDRLRKQAVGVRGGDRDEQAREEHASEPDLPQADACRRPPPAEGGTRGGAASGEVEGAGLRRGAKRTADTHRTEDARWAIACGLANIGIVLGRVRQRRQRPGVTAEHARSRPARFGAAWARATSPRTRSVATSCSFPRSGPGRRSGPP